MKKLLACMLLMMIVPAAMAEGKSYEGKVVSTEVAAVLAPAAGTIGEVMVQAGERAVKGAEVAALTTTTVYAEQAGTVKVFGSAGESVDTLTARYGAVVYIEPDCIFTISGSTSYAYDSADNKVIHPGETVYLRSSNATGRTAAGVVTAVSGSKFTVEVDNGTLQSGDTAYIYRSASYDTTSRIGRGTVTKTDPVAMTGVGVVASILVRDGAHVEPGTPLFTTVETTAAYAWQMLSPEEGVIASVSVTPGTAVEAGTLIAEVYPDSAMRLEMIVESRDLRAIHTGDRVSVTFDNGVTASGEIERISNVPYVPEASEDEAADDTVYFAVYAAFEAETAIPYGMTAKAVIAE